MNEELDNNNIDELIECMQDSPSNSGDYIEDNMVLLDTRDVSALRLNKRNFMEGVDSVSTLCGQISALCSVGITPSMALSYLSEKNTSDEINKFNLDISKINADANVKCAEYGLASFQKCSI